MEETATPDRSTMILVLGIIQIVLAGLTVLLSLFGVLMAATMSARMAHGTSPSTAMMVLPILFYLIPAANLATTGIGSVRFQPWARLATIVSAAIWLGFGALGAIGIVVSLFASRSHVGAAESLVMMMLMAPILFGVPITLLVLYTRSGVRETFARRADAQRRRS